MDGERKRRCRLQFTDLLYARVCGVILPGNCLSKRCAREKNGYVTVQRNGCHPFSIRSTSFLLPFKVRSFPCFLNGPPVKRNGQGKFFWTRTVTSMFTSFSCTLLAAVSPFTPNL